MNDTIFIVSEQALDASQCGAAQLITPLGAFETEADAKAFIEQHTAEEGFFVYHQEVTVR